MGQLQLRATVESGSDIRIFHIIPIIRITISARRNLRYTALRPASRPGGHPVIFENYKKPVFIWRVTFCPLSRSLCEGGNSCICNT